LWIDTAGLRSVPDDFGGRTKTTKIWVWVIEFGFESWVVWFGEFGEKIWGSVGENTAFGFEKALDALGAAEGFGVTKSRVRNDDIRIELRHDGLCNDREWCT